MTRATLLSESRLFSDCREADIVRVCEIAQDREFGVGELLFTHGDEARELIVVVTGTIRLELPISILGETKNIAFDTKRRGEVVSWSALVPPFRSTFSGVSGGASVMAFPRSELFGLFDADPAFGFRVMRNLAVIVAQRLQHTQVMWVREIQRSIDERYR